MALEGQHLGRLQVKDGFRLRGSEMTRIETFTDAAFAFALTLLVVSLDIPSSYGDLLEALKGVPAFALSAVLLMMFWWGHHEWSRRYGLEDASAIALSCLLVFTVLVYVYPLRFLMRGLTVWLSHISGIPFGAAAFRLTGEEVNQLFIIYGVGFVAMCLSLVSSTTTPGSCARNWGSAIWSASTRARRSGPGRSSLTRAYSRSSSRSLHHPACWGSRAGRIHYSPSSCRFTEGSCVGSGSD